MTARRPDAEPVLIAAVHVGLALVLLTPLVTAPWTLYPFSVGKALWARVFIAAAFAVWAALALTHPRWRPPRSALLVALGAGLAVAAVSAAFGVGPEMSWWSTYERMQGIVNAAHWAAFALVAASVARTQADWARLLNVNLAVGLCVSVLAIMRHLAPELPLPIPRGEGYWPRIGASAGNPILLGAYLQAIALLSAGFLVRSWCKAAPSAPAGASGGRRAARRSRKASSRRAGTASGRAVRDDGHGLRLFWAMTACSALAGVSFTGSLGALVGLGAGFGTACLLYALFGRARRVRRLGMAGLGALGTCALVLALAVALRGGDASAPRADPGVRPALGGGNVLLQRATSAEWVGFTAGNRFRIWESGVKAFAERPLLGWGPENHFVASARHISAPEGRRAKVQYHAHNLALEEAVGKGVPGLAAWLALWALTGIVALRAARRLEDARQRALAVFAAAVLAGWLAQAQTAFYSAESWLQHMLLLAFLARIEAGMRAARDGSAPRRPRRVAAALGWLRARVPRPACALAGARAVAGAAALSLAGASLASSVAIHAGAAAMWRADHRGPFIAEIERAIDAFEPLATGPRVVLFNNLALNWEVLVRTDPQEAARLLALAGSEAEAALAARPESWVLHHALARLWLKVAGTDPDAGHAARARRHLERSRVLAPGLDPMEAPLPPAR
ncbi:MAG: O-antigen ligase family protein [Boseongicola sp. SB0677_bin_26]|nr:O-antigen ligase family protein [Boseongicola sp. SB0677_bin_26]